MLKHFLKKHTSESVSFFYEKLSSLVKILESIDSGESGIDGYSQVNTILEDLEIATDGKNLFHAECLRKGESPIKISSKSKKRLLEVVDMLDIMFQPSHTRINSFTSRFKSVYGERAVKLTEALNPKNGIEYYHNSTPHSKLLKDLSFSNGFRDTPLSKVEKYLLQKVTEVLRAGKKTVILDRNEILEVFKKDKSSGAISLNLSYSQYGYKILFDGAFGNSAINMLSRFGHISDEVVQISQSIFKEEKKIGGIHADVSYINELGLANIAAHPSISDYELPLLLSGKHPKTLNINQMYLRLIDDEIFLFYKEDELEKIVIPRILSAGNYDFKSTPIVRFLGDLQKILGGSVVFDWGNLANFFSFLPRVEYHNVIISPARWKLSNTKDIIARNNILDFFQKENIPLKFFLKKDGESKYYFDLNNSTSCKHFKKQISKSNSVVLEEFIDRRASIFCDKKNRNYSHEILIPIVRKDIKNRIKYSPNIQLLQQKNYILGSEWLYLKLYLNENNSTDFIKKCLSPLKETLIKEKLVKLWFFIRYVDNEGFHLRIRFKIDERNLGFIINAIFNRIQPYYTERILHKVSYDTYTQESQRYDLLNMDWNEYLFNISSDIVCDYLLEGTSEENHFFAFYFLDYFLTQLNFDIKKKHDFTRFCTQSFKNEFSLHGKRNNSIILKKFLLHKDLLTTSLNNSFYEKTIFKYKNRIEKAASVILLHKNQQSVEKYYNFLWSHLHMHFNRLFQGTPRKQEAVLYFISEKFYKQLLNENQFKKQ